MAIARIGGETVICLKAERDGTEYTHHYLVPLAPSRGEGTGLVYVDPDMEIMDGGGRLVISLATAESGTAPDVGDILENPKGAFLKVRETYRSQKMFAFIDIATGTVRRRQERGLINVYRNWRIEGLAPHDGAADAATISLADLEQAVAAVDPPAAGA